MSFSTATKYYSLFLNGTEVRQAAWSLITQAKPARPLTKRVVTFGRLRMLAGTSCRAARPP